MSLCLTRMNIIPFNQLISHKKLSCINAGTVNDMYAVSFIKIKALSFPFFFSAGISYGYVFKTQTFKLVVNTPAHTHITS